MKEFSKLLRYSREAVALLPTMVELELRFPHGGECEGKSSLIASSETVMVDSGDPRVGSVGMRSYFLKCSDCNVKRTYRK